MNDKFKFKGGDLVMFDEKGMGGYAASYPHCIGKVGIVLSSREDGCEVLTKVEFNCGSFFDTVTAYEYRFKTALEQVTGVLEIGDSL